MATFFINASNPAFPAIQQIVLGADPAASVIMHQASALSNQTEFDPHSDYIEVTSPVLTPAQVIGLIQGGAIAISDAALARIAAARGTAKALPNWATWTAQEASDFVTANILNGFDQAAANNFINTTIVNITTANVAQVNAQLANIRTVLQAVAAAIISIRTILAAMAKAVVYIRNLLLRQ